MCDLKTPKLKGCCIDVAEAKATMRKQLKSNTLLHHMVVSQIDETGGPQYGPLNTIPLILENPHVTMGFRVWDGVQNHSTNDEQVACLNPQP